MAEKDQELGWEPEIEEIHRRRELARQQGGPEGIEKQHSRGKLTIRERIDGLADKGTFREYGLTAGDPEYEDGELKSFTPANYVVGMADIDGRRCILGGEDFTLKGGSPNGAGLRKSVFAEDAALEYELPLIRFLEGGGGSVGSPGPRPRGPVGGPVFSKQRFKSIGDVLDLVPVASAAVGAVAGFPAARLVASHFSVMLKDTAQILIGGPALVERALGENLTKEELGNYLIHQKSGVVDNVAEDEEDAFRQIRQFLSYLPTSIHSTAPVTECDDPADRQEEELLNIVPKNRRRAYQMRKVINHIVDRDSFFEMSEKYGRGQIVGLARLTGQPVGVIANDCMFYAGAMTAEGAQKVRRHVDFCNQFHLPIISLVDEPGFMIGSEAEKSATIRYGMETIKSVVQSDVPWANIQIRKSFGVAGAAHFGPNGYSLIWPSVESGALPIEGGVAVAYRREIAAAPDPDAKRQELEDALAARQSPFPRAESFSVHELVDPRETRPFLAEWISWLGPKLERLARDAKP